MVSEKALICQYEQACRAHVQATRAVKSAQGERHKAAQYAREKGSPGACVAYEAAVCQHVRALRAVDQARRLRQEAVDDLAREP